MDTGRRSFLSAALAWIAAVVASLWPRRALSSPVRARGPFTRPSRPADPDVLRLNCYDDPPSKDTYREQIRLYKDAGRMLDEMHARLCETGHSVLVADDPERLRFGFVTFDAAPGAPEDRVVWQTGIVGVKKLQADLAEGRIPASFSDPSPEAAEVLLEYLGDSGGRQVLAAAYEGAGKARFERGLGPLPT